MFLVFVQSLVLLIFYCSLFENRQNKFKKKFNEFYDFCNKRFVIRQIRLDVITLDFVLTSATIHFKCSAFTEYNFTDSTYEKSNSFIAFSQRSGEIGKTKQQPMLTFNTCAPQRIHKQILQSYILQYSRTKYTKYPTVQTKKK